MPDFERKEVLENQIDGVTVVGSVMFPKYGQDGTPDQLRGKQAIKSLVKIAKMGANAAVIVGPGTDSRFISDLEEALGENRQKIVLEEEGKRGDRGYSGARRQAIELAREKFTGNKVLVMQEIEKDLTGHYEELLGKLEGKALVMMNRGVAAPYSEFPWDDSAKMGANLPGAQFWGERRQDVWMANQEQAAFGIKGNYWDRLNGTRAIRDQPMNIGGVEINPVDLMLLKYRYTDGYDEGDRANKIDAYSAAVYNLIPLLESVGGVKVLDQVGVQYWHSEAQREQEENDPKFKAKRLGHQRDLPAINFDVVCNILKWKEEGKWPEVLTEALKGDKELKIEHFDKDRWSIQGGVLVSK